jgi:hypothetical protein
MRITLGNTEAMGGGMRVARHLALLLVAAVVLALASCSSGGPDAIVVPTDVYVGGPQADFLSLAGQYHLVLAGSTHSIWEVVFSPPLRREWAEIQSACLVAGFDLRPYAGRAARLVRHPVRKGPLGPTAALWVVQVDGRLVGAYVAARWDRGVLSLKQASQRL